MFAQLDAGPDYNITLIKYALKSWIRKDFILIWKKQIRSKDKKFLKITADNGRVVCENLEHRHL